ncbi:MAG TPA: PAS domain-containing sensor histidine kinase [Gammaproteobacteria bacterium]|nr:PAS domain-containing sensor histidine kinase [Gammaproteobacteria bacterium]
MADIDLKQRVQDLEQEIDYLKQILEHIPTHVYWKNKKGVYQGCNKAQAATLGLKSINEFSGKTIDQLIHSDYIPAIVKNDQKIMRSKQTQTIEESCPDTHGNPAIYLSKKTPLFDKKGRVTGLLGVSTDITELKKTEFLSSIYFQNILDVLPENFYWADKEGVILGCNNNQAKFFGLQSSTSLIGKTIYEAAENSGWSQETINALRKNHNRVMRAQTPMKVEEICIIDGTPRTFLSYKNPLINHKKQVMGVFSVTVDITEQKELEKALRVAKEKAEEMNRMKSEFIHNMEHDIRTPFAGIYGMSTTLAQRETDPEKKEALELIAHSSEELLSYANHILSFAQVEEEFSHIIVKEFDLHKLINAIISMERPAAKNKGIELHYTLPKNIPETLVGDVNRLKSILINLISNAIKFTKKGSVSVDVKLEHKNKKQAVLSFTVKDTGIGIPKDKIHLIYDKYFCLNPNNDTWKSFGLGLKIVNKFVEELGGEIKLDSILGNGSTFTVTLPFQIPL